MLVNYWDIFCPALHRHGIMMIAGFIRSVLDQGPYNKFIVVTYHSVVCYHKLYGHITIVNDDDNINTRLMAIFQDNPGKPVPE